MERLLSADEAAAWAGWTRSTMYQRIRAGHFPRPVVTGPKSVRWRESDLNAWLDSRPLGAEPGKQPREVLAVAT
ncbi:MAG: AlpA family phage regulatory protein [Chloroflexi bacterium]|nr:AlpA family phage regulatory protein [Chloroflexota bacterium]MYE40728.1 AlpA family phage regulatory protein [Chloroflexota bacterium]